MLMAVITVDSRAGCEQMQCASIAWQPNAWMLARRAGTAHDGNAAGRPEVPVAEVLEAVVVVAGVWAAA